MLFGQLYYPASVPYVASAKIGEHYINTLNCARNPSLVPYIANTEAAIYSEKKYLTDINLLMIAVSAPFKTNGVSFGFQHFGNTLFNEQAVSLSYGKSFGNINAGLIFEWIRVKFQGLETRRSFLQTGLFSTIRIGENVFAGINILNPRIIVKSAETEIHPASSFSLILGWESSDVAYAGLESKKEEGRPLSVVIVLQYHFAAKFYACLNWNTAANQPYSAIGWRLNDFVFEAGCSYHAALGASPSICLIYKKRHNG